MKYIALIFLFFSILSCEHAGPKLLTKETDDQRTDRLYWVKSSRHLSAAKIRDSLIARERALEYDELISMYHTKDGHPDKAIDKERNKTNALLEKQFYVVDSILKDNTIYNHE